MSRRGSRRERDRQTLLNKVVEHELNPISVRVLSREEARQVLRRLHLKPWNLPWIRASDPLVAAVGARPGDILEVVRRSPKAGQSVIYRLVVPG